MNVCTGTLEVKEGMGLSPGHGAESVGVGTRTVIFLPKGIKHHNTPVLEDAEFLAMLRGVNCSFRQLQQKGHEIWSGHKDGYKSIFTSYVTMDKLTFLRSGVLPHPPPPPPPPSVPL